jgi:Spy/CpxP family protein refolding chaperone
MTKLIALVTAGLFAAGTMFAGEHGNCTKQVGNEAKAACQVSLASLNLTPEQKTKMDTAMAEHQKAGCSEASESKYMQEAKSILTPEQYAKFNAECKKGGKDKTQT